MSETTTKTAIDYVRSPREAAERLGISMATLRRMAQRGEGPQRIRISDRRIGYPDSALAAFVASRSIA
ncbi:MAG TPA: helix-turn-helix domain-containing protein [Pseudolabrys sp.]|nr:helix-turn-helix domain-containing protein [Pseudolabrys sp.]